MRKGYILLHRQGITQDEWKHPRRTLAWIDVLTLVDHTTGIATMSYGFLATRWRVSKDTAFQWIKHWITERQLERLPERDTERNAERYFVVNYAKYQKTTERTTERQPEPGTERSTEQRYTVSSIPEEEHQQEKALVAKATEEDLKIALHLFDLILTTNPADRTKHEKNPKQKDSRAAKWAEDIEKLKRIDGATDEQIAFMLKWLFTSNMKNALFWQKNIRSGSTLREKWPQLVMWCKEDHQRKTSSSLSMPENL